MKRQNSTACARGGAVAGEPHGATSAPIYQTATFAQDSAERFGDFDYTRTDNPTRQALESLLAELEGGHGALTFSSGMAAIAAVLREAPPGSRVICSRDLYGGTQRFLHGHLPGITPVHLDLAPADGCFHQLEAELARGDVSVVLLESPSNPRLQVADIARIAALTRGAGALLVVDGTAMTPWLQQPLALGADVAVHSATKGLGGHGDVTAGVVCTSNEDVLARLSGRRNAEGTALAPFESWLLLRGLRTLGVRVDAAQRTALQVARWLEAQSSVKAALYPGLPQHPGFALHRRQARGGGVVISIDLESAHAAKRLVEDTRLFTTAVSFGGVASSISLPRAMSHASIPEGAAPRPAETLVRISIGLESAEDLIADLERALPRADRAGRERGTLEWVPDEAQLSPIQAETAEVRRVGLSPAGGRRSPSA